MAHLTKTAALAASILQQMTRVGRWQRQFLLHLFPLLLSMWGRYNFTHLARYGQYDPATYGRSYAKEIDWLEFNLGLVERYLSVDRITYLDPSYITKSGKHSARVNYSWSGSAGQAKWGQEFCGLAAVDRRDKTALHLRAVQTVCLEEGESLLDYYASIATLNAARLRRVSPYVVADAYFAKAGFAESVRAAGLHLNTRLRKDQVLYHLYQGPRRPGPGAPKRYAGRVEVANLRPDIFTPCVVADDGPWTAFEAAVYVKAWKHRAKVVVLQRYDSEGNFCAHSTLVTTDQQQSGADLVPSYNLPFSAGVSLPGCQAGTWPGRLSGLRMVQNRLLSERFVDHRIASQSRSLPRPRKAPRSTLQYGRPQNGIRQREPSVENNSRVWVITRPADNGLSVYKLLPQIRKHGKRAA